jgi:hypothetical protein
VATATLSFNRVVIAKVINNLKVWAIGFIANKDAH